MAIKMADLQIMADAARNLHTPGDDFNPEYTRGQVELICDVSGVPNARDAVAEIVEKYITHRSREFLSAIAQELLSTL